MTSEEKMRSEFEQSNCYTGSMRLFGCIAERLREERDSQQRVCIKVMEERDQLRAEVDALRKDAERYQWLRDSEELEGLVFSSINEWLLGSGDFQEVSAAIDAEIARSRT